MQKFWNFPAVLGGNINSINNAGLETFRGNEIDSLTREICQNSLDAVKNQTQPVVVEFKHFRIQTSQFPELKQLRNSFERCQATWEGKNEKSEEFIQSGLKLMNQPKLDFLRISDFNTKGLEGAKEGEIGSPWSSLVKESGSSNKGDSSGGSFGIGKSAPFLNSKLRTLFYASLDKTSYQSYIGVSNIMSYITQDKKTTLGSGYYTKDNDSRAIPGEFILDESFERKETGTDVYVSAFYPQEDWEKEMKESVLHNFFIPVFNKELVVNINGFEITNQNIGQLIEDLNNRLEKNRILKSYFSLLTSDQVVRLKYPAKNYKGKISFEEGEAELLLLKGEDLNRRVLMTRKTGMRLFEQKNISGSISFTGLLRIKGKNMNLIFKDMENPAHTEWAPNRYEKDPKLATKIYADLRKFIRDTVKDLFQETVTDEMDAVGLSDFLPNTNLIDDEGNEERESLNARVKSLVAKKKTLKKKAAKKSTRKGEEVADIEQQLVGDFGITEGDTGGNGEGQHGEGGGDAGAGLTDTDGSNELDKDEKGNTNVKPESAKKKKAIGVTQKYICLDKENGKYRFILFPEKAISKGELAFRVHGEQSDYDIPIKSATSTDVEIKNCASNTVTFHATGRKKQLILNVEIDYDDYCVLAVDLYEN